MNKTNERDASTESQHKPEHYEIRVKGHLDKRWADWFDGMQITLEPSGNTRLSGAVLDQAALYGLLRRIRDCGLPLLSVICLETDQTKSISKKK